MISGAPRWPRAPWTVRSVPSALVGALIVGVLSSGKPAWVTALVVSGACVAGVVGARSGRPARSGALLLAALLVVSGQIWGGARQSANHGQSVTNTTTVEGRVVVDRPPERTKRGGWQAVLRAEGLPGAVRGLRILGDLPAAAGAALRGGERLLVRGRLSPPAGRNAPGWWRAHLDRIGIGARLSVGEFRVVGRRGGLVGARDQWRATVRQAAGAGLRGDERALVRGITIGAVDELSEESASALRAAGLWHLVAVSGQNVAIVGLAVMWLTRRLGSSRRAAIGVAIAAICLYCLACSGGASVTRAGVMGVVAMVALARGSGSVGWHSLLVGLAALLCWNPSAIGDPGLQLSFAAVVGLMGLSPITCWYLRGWAPGWLAELLGISIAAGLCTAPVLAWHFGQLSLVGLALNLLAVPLSAPILVLGLLGVAVSPVSTVLAEALAALAGLGAQLMIWVAGVGASLPGATATVSRAWVGPLVALAALPVVVAWCLARPPRPVRRQSGRRTAPIAAATILVTLVLTWPRHRSTPWPVAPTIRVLEVGQGDAILIQDPSGAAALVDSGPAGDQPAAVAALARFGVHHLDALVLTHGQADHAGGASAVLRAMGVEMLLVPPLPGPSLSVDAATAAARRGTTQVLRPLAGTSVALGAWSLSILSPVNAPRAGTDPNDGAVVMLAEANGRRALLTADAESNVLGRLALPRIDVLKVSHHGSRDDGLERLLGRIDPSVSVVSVGPNSYGHPDPQTVEALRDTGSVFRTDQSGDVTVTFVPDGTVVSTARGT